MASCADQFDQNFQVGRPDRAEQYGYLNDYKPLKEYVSNPSFHLGVGTTVNDYLKQELVYALTNSNFNETVAGNAMKMASCVDDKGEMNFSTVSEYVKTATDAGMNVYGHTLAWHAQQPVKWLNSLIADKPVPVVPGGEQEKEDYYQDLTEFASFPYYVMGYTPNFSKEEGLISESPGSWYQYFIATGIATEPDKDYTYKITCEVKSDKTGDVAVQMRWSWGEDPANATLKVTEGDWHLVSCEVSGVKGSPCDIIFQPGGFDGRFCIKNIKVSHIEQGAGPIKYWESVIKNGNMEGGEAANFAKKENSGSIVYEITNGVGKDGSRGVKIASNGGQADAWESQFWIVSDAVLMEGEKVHVKFDYRAEGGAVGTSVDTQAHFGPGEYQHWQCAGSPAFTADWQTYDKEFTVDASMASNGKGMKSVAFNMSPNATDGAYYIDNVVLEVEREIAGGGPVTYWAELITNSDMEGTDNSCFVTKENNGAVVNSAISDGAGKDGSRGIQVTSNAGAANDWDTQFWIRLPQVLEEGTKMHVQFDYKASTTASADTQSHAEPGAYVHWACVGSPEFTTDWQHFDKEVTVDGSMAAQSNFQSIAFNLAKDRSNNVTYYFDNISVQVEQESTSGGIPQSAEEKRDTLTGAMDKWISGMIEACKDESGNTLVKAWDVVNEAISGGNPDSEGVYALQHGSADNTTDFFWQDHMGDLDYVRTAVRLARQYGGEDLKLFVNDYNLESDWDQNGKLKSLIKWIERWEADGVTKIDGIGSQMHISCYMNPQTQESKKKAIESSFRLMAESGKLVRISELDMGLVDADGNDVITSDVTEEQHKQMSEFYKWIVEKYLEIIPAAQQWGICQWCATDSPAGSGWRANQPVGLWDLDYYRKHTYAGFADGLSGK